MFDSCFQHANQVDISQTVGPILSRNFLNGADLRQLENFLKLQGSWAGCLIGIHSKITHPNPEENEEIFPDELKFICNFLSDRGLDQKILEDSLLNSVWCLAKYMSV